MAGDDTLRHLRGTLVTALLWGGGWFAAVLAAVAAFTLLSIVGIVPAGFSLREALSLPFRAGIVGAVVGVAFSASIRLLYRGRRLSDLSWVRFGIGGGLLTGVFVPLFLQAMNLLSGDGLVPWELVLDDGLWTAVFGGVLAGGSLKLAQRADHMLPPRARDQLAGVEGTDQSASEDAWRFRFSVRLRMDELYARIRRRPVP